MGVLPPWPRAMASHPPVHDRVPAGAGSPDGAPWLAPRSADWRVPVRALSQLFRGKCKAKSAHAPLRAHAPAHVWHPAWGTHGAPVGTGPAGLTALAPSLRRLAMTHHRMAQLADGSGT